MFPFASNFKLDITSFWIGFLAGALVIGLVNLLRRVIPQVVKAIRKQIIAAREALTASTEARLLNDTIRLAQRNHLSAALFLLDEIIIEPRLLIPPAPVEPGIDSPELDIVNRTLPYMPDWPELTAAFNAPTITLAEALSLGANLALMGQPGSGKTVALSHLAMTLARAGSKVDGLAGRLPLLVHAADLPLDTLAARAPLDSLYTAVAAYATPLTLPRLAYLLRNVFEEGRALVLLDGLDELPPATIKPVVDYLGILLKQYPRTRLVAAVSLEFYDGLTLLNLSPVAMATWTTYQRVELVDKWRALWTPTLFPDLGAGTIDTLLLKYWLAGYDHYLTPLEYTLKIWAAFAGDALGPDLPRCAEAYIRRMTPNIPNARPALETIARQIVTSLAAVVYQKEAENWVVEFEQPATYGEVDARPDAAAQKKPAPPRVIPSLIQKGLLSAHADARIRFCHPVILGYLAGNALVKQGSLGNLPTQPEWAGKSTTLSFMACFGDVTALVNQLIDQTDDPLLRGALIPAHWLRIAPKNAAWRGVLLRHLASMFQRASATLGLSARFLAALITSGETGMAHLFRQLLTHENANLRLLAALGCGLIKEAKTIEPLGMLIIDPVTEVNQAACLALKAIGSKEALDVIVSTLLQGSEEKQVYAAEVFSTDPEEGHPILKEAVTFDDLMVRRAAVTGLSNIKEEWSKTILEKMAVEDGQWVVRNAAAQALEQVSQPNPCIPRPFGPLHQTPWLIAFAAKQGIGVVPGKPAYNLLVKAIKDGKEDQRLAALAYIRLFSSDEAVVQLYHTLYASEGALHEAAFDTLWHIGATGITLPSPVQFGLA